VFVIMHMCMSLCVCACMCVFVCVFVHVLDLACILGVFTFLCTSAQMVFVRCCVFVYACCV